MDKPILCAKCNDHIIADDGAVCEICADTQDTIITELQARIAELEKLAVVWEKCESREQIDHSRRYCVICDRGELWICYLPAPPEEQ